MKTCLFYTLSLLLVATSDPLAAARTVEFESTEVTAADVALAPDEQWLIFTMLGHLFRLPVEGGTAEQLTFGPYYDTDPEVSPDGINVVFISDRDDSEGNVFVLNLRTREIRQITHEAWAAHPTWHPDGQVIAYLRMARDVPGVVPSPRFGFPYTVPSTVHEVSMPDGEPEMVRGAPEIISSLFYLSDGRLGWTVVKLESRPSSGTFQATSHIEIRSMGGAVSTLRTIAGYVAPCVPTAARNGFYCRRFHPLPSWYTRPVEDLLFAGLDNKADQVIFRLTRPRGWIQRFAVASDNSLFIGESGRLWKISGPGPVHEFIPFNALIQSEIRDPVAPSAPAFLSDYGSFPPRNVRYPRLSPDGRTLVFQAAGHIWQQPLPGGSATRLIDGNFLESDPAFSPDGRQLAYVQRQGEQETLAVFDFANRRSRKLFTTSCCWKLSQPSWSPDGRRLTYGDSVFSVINVATGEREVVGRVTSITPARPHFSADGDWIYTSSESDGTGAIFRQEITSAKDPESIMQLTGRVFQGLISPDGNWLAFKRTREIWVAPFRGQPVNEEDVRLLTREGGPGFAFTPDATAIIYAAGNRVWRHSLAKDEREEIPIRLELERPIPPPLLLRRVRLLDFDSSRFRVLVSVYIEQGRINWIGVEDRHEVPDDVLIVDGGGRFVIPGLFDMHVHGVAANQKSFIAYGVTSVRDLGGWLPGLHALSDRADSSTDPVPRYFMAGVPLNSPESGGVIVNQVTARAEVRQRKSDGLQLIKARHPTLDWPILKAVVDEARQQSLPVVGHGFKGIEEIIKSITLGFASLEHTTTPGRLYEDVLHLLALSSTRWDPTLTTRGSFIALRDEPERLNDSKLRAFTPEWLIRQAQTLRYFDGLATIGENEFRGRWSMQLASVGDAYRHGVHLLIGTGAGNPGIFFGAHLHWELEFFVQAGLPPLDVLRIATLEAAQAVGAADHLGTLEPGKLADMVLLDENPLEDIKNTQTIWRVLKGGWVYDPEQLR